MDFNEIFANLDDKQKKLINDLFKQKDKEMKTLKQENDLLKNNLASNKNKVEELTNLSSTNNELKQRLSELTVNMQDNERQYKSELIKMRKNNAIKLALTKEKCYDIDLVSKLINLDRITIDDTDDSIYGLENQLAALKNDKPFLFNFGNVQTVKVEGTGAPASSLPNEAEVEADKADSVLLSLGKDLANRKNAMIRQSYNFGKKDNGVSGSN